MGAFTNQGYDLTNPGTPEHLEGKQVSSGFFGTMGVELSLGRDFSTQEDVHGGPLVAVISDHLWKDRSGWQRSRPLGKPLTFGTGLITRLREFFLRDSAFGATQMSIHR